MKQFEARLAWRRGSQPFTDQRYSRAHDKCYIANSLKGEIVVEGQG
jgi:organic hydroperoxide reductase OsmC/OhrA